MEKVILTNLEVEEFVEAISQKIIKRILPVVQAASDKKEKEGPVYLKVKEAAAMIGHSKDFVYKLVKEGELTGYSPGADLVVRKDELQAFMERSKIGAKTIPLKKII